MDPITESLRRHYSKKFSLHGPTSEGVDWENPLQPPQARVDTARREHRARRIWLNLVSDSRTRRAGFGLPLPFAGEQAVLPGVVGQFSAGPDLELLESVREVRTHGSRRDPQLFGDGFVRLS